MGYLGNAPADQAVQIGDGVVDTAQLAADAVTSAKIEDNAVDTEHLADDAIEAAELASDAVVNASVDSGAAIAYSKLGAIPTFNQNTTGNAATVTTNANLTGEVTSSGNTATVADNIIDEANLNVSNAPTDGHMLTAQSGNTGGLTWAAAGGASIDEANVGFKTMAGGDFTVAADTTSNLGVFSAGTTLPGGWFYVCYVNEVNYAGSNMYAVAYVSTSKRATSPGTYNQTLGTERYYADNNPPDSGGWLMSGTTLQLRNPYDAERVYRYSIVRVFGTDDNDDFTLS
jgi:hypothetical protein